MSEIEGEFPFQKQWREYRRRRNQQYVIGTVGLVAPALIFFAVRNSGMEANKAIVLLCFLSVVAVVVIVSVMMHFHRWICPKCEKRFFVRSFWNRFPEFLANCSNCGWQKYKGSTFG